MKKVTKLQYFSPSCPPRVYWSEPEEFISQDKNLEDLQTDSVLLEVDEDENEIWVRGELDYDGCIYESDTPRIKLIKFVRQKNVPNPQYKKQLAAYNKHVQEIKVEKALWDQEMENYNKIEEERKEKRDRREFARLKKKYAKNN